MKFSASPGTRPRRVTAQSPNTVNAIIPNVETGPVSWSYSEAVIRLTAGMTAKASMPVSAKTIQAMDKLRGVSGEFGKERSGVVALITGSSDYIDDQDNIQQPDEDRGSGSDRISDGFGVTCTCLLIHIRIPWESAAAPWRSITDRCLAINAGAGFSTPSLSISAAFANTAAFDGSNTQSSVQLR